MSESSDASVSEPKEQRPKRKSQNTWLSYVVGVIVDQASSTLSIQLDGHLPTRKDANDAIRPTDS